MLRKAYVLEDPQTKRNKTRSGYLTLAFSGGPKDVGNPTSPSPGSATKVEKTRSGYLTPTSSGAQKRAEMRRHLCILGGPQQRAGKSKVATSHLPPRGPKKGRKCYITPAFSGVPNKGEQNQKWLPHPTFYGAQKRAEMLRRPCILGGPQQTARKPEVATSPVPSRVPKRGRKCDVTPAFSGVPNKGEHNQKWLPHPCLLRGHQRGRKCYITRAFSGVPNKREQNQIWLPHPCLLRGPQRGRKCYVRPMCSKIPKPSGTKPEVATSPLRSPGAQKTLEILRHPLGGPQQR